MHKKPFRTAVEEIVDETVPKIQAELESYLRENPDVEIDSRGIYHDYSGIGQLLHWTLHQPNVREVKILTDLALADDDSVLDAVCRHLCDLLAVEPTAVQDGNLRESLTELLQKRSQKIIISVCHSNGSVEREIEIP